MRPRRPDPLVRRAATATPGTTSRRRWPSPWRATTTRPARRTGGWPRTQLGDGSWFNYYLGDRVKDARLDTNVCAYVATGVYHYLLATGDVDFAVELWPDVERAIEFVLRWQLDDGTVRWSLDALGRPESYALLTGSSSIFHALRCAVALAERLGDARPAWELAAGRLGHAVAHHPGAFAPKNEFAMDWYYPIFSGALDGEAGERRLDDGWERHVMDDYGVRCVSTSDWVTAAETAECVLTLDALGMTSARPRALRAHAAPPARRRRVLDGPRLPRGATFPGGRDDLLHRGRGPPGRRRARRRRRRPSGLFRHGALRAPDRPARAGLPARARQAAA